MTNDGRAIQADTQLNQLKNQLAQLLINYRLLTKQRETVDMQIDAISGQISSLQAQQRKVSTKEMLKKEPSEWAVAMADKEQAEFKEGRNVNSE